MRSFTKACKAETECVPSDHIPHLDGKEGSTATTGHVIICVCCSALMMPVCLPSDHEPGEGDQGDAVEEDRLRT